jgi:hypothetical protein
VTANPTLRPDQVRFPIVERELAGHRDLFGRSLCPAKISDLWQHHAKSLLGESANLSPSTPGRLQALTDDLHRLIADAWRDFLFSCFQPVDEFE